MSGNYPARVPRTEPPVTPSRQIVNRRTFVVGSILTGCAGGGLLTGMAVLPLSMVDNSGCSAKPLTMPSNPLFFRQMTHVASTPLAGLALGDMLGGTGACTSSFVGIIS
jgi:hypothetical protein